MLLIITLFLLFISPFRPPLTIPPPRQPPGPYHEQILSSSSLFARPLGEGPDSYVTEQQIKRYAMEGFDRPGFCFYVSHNDNIMIITAVLQIMIISDDIFYFFIREMVIYFK